MTRVVGLISKYFNHDISSSNIKHIKYIYNMFLDEQLDQEGMKAARLSEAIFLVFTVDPLPHNLSAERDVIERRAGSTARKWLTDVHLGSFGDGGDSFMVFYVVMTTCQILSVVWSVLFLSLNDLHVTPDISRHIEVAFSKRGQCWTNFSMEHMEPEWDHWEII